MSISYEIDFLPVNNGERSGDAICLRYGSPGNYRVLIYDGGNKTSGTGMVRHIRRHYGTNAVDDVVCSHPDPDHIAGLAVVLEHMRVGRLWMHRPWAHSDAVGRLVRQGRMEDSHPHPRARAMAAAHALEMLAARKGVTLREPFQGDVIGEFMVLSPGRGWYLDRLAVGFDAAAHGRARPTAGLLRKAMASARAAACRVAESWGVETLREDTQSSFENDSSVVLFGMPAERGVLLTGDAGVRALTGAAAFAEARGMSIRDTLTFMQIPHYGDRRNVSPSLLDRLLGPKTDAQTDDRRITAFVSTVRDAQAHPHEAVVNAFTRRGARVIATNGAHKCHHFNMDARAGWQSVMPTVMAWNMETLV